MRKFNRTYAKKPKDLNKGELMGNGHLDQQTRQMLLVGYTIAFLAKVEVRFFSICRMVSGEPKIDNIP